MRWVIAARWTARVFGTLLLAFYAFFILAEGLPPIAAQPEGVQLNFVALGLMLAGFVAGWKREGTAALLIACGWTLWQISEGRIKWNLFQTPLPVAMLYGFCWWATRGRRTSVVVGAVVTLAVALGLGQLFLPTSVFVRGAVVDAQTGQPVPNVELRLLPRTPRALEKGDLPNARANQNGRFTLYVGWYAAAKQVALSAPGYATLTTNLGPRGLGERSVSRDFQLRPVAGAMVEPEVPPVVINTIPESGTANVDPAIAELRVTFSKPMRDGSWSWTIWGEENFPETTGAARYLADGRTCVLPVKLKPGKLYAIWLNSEHHHDFKDREGKSAVPYLLIFETRK
jgi:RNA polymerase sigma-70 factor (ECF subfamily)